MWRVACITLVVFFESLAFSNGVSEVPCFYIFGDSLYDNGNNDGLLTLAKANYPPYGIDFQGSRPTGRFTNGLTMVDVIAKLLGFNHFIPPFADTSKGIDVTKGLNYASGAAGIRNETGYMLGQRIPLAQQVSNHLSIISTVASVNGTPAEEYFKKCLYMINIGSNDYINNYYAPKGYISQLLYTPEQFATVLVEEYAKQIEILYANGARKVVLSGLGLIGCALGEVLLYGPSSASGCVDDINNAVQLFNSKLVFLVDELNLFLTNAKFTYLDTIALAPTEGIKVLNTSCCLTRQIDGMCIAHSTPCSNRSDYYFWDLFHSTEVVYVISGERAFKSNNSNYVHHLTISELVNLPLPDYDINTGNFNNRFVSLRVER